MIRFCMVTYHGDEDEDDRGESEATRVEHAGQVQGGRAYVWAEAREGSRDMVRPGDAGQGAAGDEGLDTGEEGSMYGPE
jgi:hypothetical protein